jgi:hypothetical protein
MDSSSSEKHTEITISFRGLTRKQFLLTTAGALLSLILATTAIGYIHQHTALAGLPRDAYQNLAFPVYFPKHPPQSFTLDEDSISSKPLVLAYSYKYENGNLVYISIQPLDPQLDISSFRTTREISPSIGKGYLVEYEERTTIAIVTKESLVLMNAPRKVPGFALEQLAESLFLVK